MRISIDDACDKADSGVTVKRRGHSYLVERTAEVWAEQVMADTFPKARSVAGRWKAGAAMNALGITDDLIPDAMREKLGSGRNWRAVVRQIADQVGRA